MGLRILNWDDFIRCHLEYLLAALLVGFSPFAVADVDGQFRYNSGTGRFEGYEGGAWKNVITSGTVTSVTPATGLVSGVITGTGTLNVDVGTTANKIMQVTSSTQIPAIDGFLITNVNATKLRSNNVATGTPAGSQVLMWNATTSQWNADVVTNASFSTMTSAQLAGIISDETGSGTLVFGTTPTFTTNLTSPLIIGGTGTTSTLTFKTTSGVGTTNADMIFQVGNNGGTEAMRILNSGNVGIGTTTPNYKIDVYGGDVNIASGQYYRYNGQPVISAITANTDYFLGGAGKLTATGSYITGAGPQALGSLTSGTENTAFGYYANGALTTGNYNTAIGENALQNQTSGDYNVALGRQAGYNVTTGGLNIYIGELAGYYDSSGATTINSTGSGNIVIGTQQNMLPSHTGSNQLNIGNLIFGTGLAAGSSVSTGNVGIGTTTPNSKLEIDGAKNTTLLNLNMTNPTAVSDYLAIDFNRGGSQNVGRITAYLDSATQSGGLTFATAPDGSTISERMRINYAGNVGIGTTTPAYKLDVNGDINVAAGSAYKYNGTSIIIASIALQNYFFGNAAGNLSMAGGSNTGVGFQSLNGNTTGTSNVSMGYQSMVNNTTGTSSVGVGYNTLYYQQTGGSNVAIGTQAGQGAAAYNSTGNTLVGERAGINLATGSGYNTFFGSAAGYGVTTGTHNIIIGDHENTGGNLTTGSYNIGIGWDMAFPSATASNQLNIGNLIFGTGMTTSTTVSTGKVGIGTTCPATSLEIAGSNAAIGTGWLDKGNLFIRSTDALAADKGGTLALGAVKDGSGGTFAAAKIHGKKLNGNSGEAGGYLAFEVGYNGASPYSFERMRIIDNGNVGIGTTTPAVPLHISTTSNPVVYFDVFANVVNQRLRRANGTPTVPTALAANDIIGNVSFTGYGATAFAANSSASIKAIATEAFTDSAQGGALTFSTITTGTTSIAERMRLDGSGNVGIGVTNPSYTLHVVGTAGLSTGTAWTNASDIRLKDIHGDYEYGLDEVVKLHSVRFNYKKNNPLGLPSDHAMTGFIAQEVEKIIPEAVQENKNGYLELNVDPIHWAVVNAVKQLKSLIDSIYERKADKSEIVELKARVEKAERENAERESATVIKTLAMEAENEKLKQENAEIKIRLDKIEKMLNSK